MSSILTPYLVCRWFINIIQGCERRGRVSILILGLQTTWYVDGILILGLQTTWYEDGILILGLQTTWYVDGILILGLQTRRQGYFNLNSLTRKLYSIFILLK